MCVDEPGLALGGSDHTAVVQSPPRRKIRRHWTQTTACCNVVALALDRNCSDFGNVDVGEAFGSVILCRPWLFEMVDHANGHAS